MINDIQGGSHVVVTQARTRFPYIDPYAQGSGHVRWNSAMRCFEISDGVVWHHVDFGSVHIALSEETQKILSWANEKKAQEDSLSTRCAQYPALKQAWEHFLIMNQLTENYEKS